MSCVFFSLLFLFDVYPLSSHLSLSSLYLLSHTCFDKSALSHVLNQSKCWSILCFKPNKNVNLIFPPKINKVKISSGSILLLFLSIYYYTYSTIVHNDSIATFITCIVNIFLFIKGTFCLREVYIYSFIQIQKSAQSWARTLPN